MPDKYTAQDKQLITILIRRMYKKVKQLGMTYRQVAPLVKATPATVHRWFHAKDNAWPSRTHVEHIKVFLGYINA